MKHISVLTIFFVSASTGCGAVIIQQSPIVVGLGEGNVNFFEFDMNGDGHVDWSLVASSSDFFYGVNADSPLTSGFVYQTTPPDRSPRVRPLAQGSLIGNSFESPTFEWYRGFAPELVSGSSQHSYFWGAEGYLGFQFESDQGVHYGYAYLVSNNEASITVTEYAWETVPGRAIRAGNIPEPSSCLLLLAAVLGASRMRRR